jgi:hypothetical protein
MASRVFFVRHGLSCHGQIPGRYPFDVTGLTLRRESAGRRRLTQFIGQVYVDGYGPNTRGPNIDPHVFSDALPWFHSFCLMDKGIERQHVIPGGGVLSEVVSPGDLVFYGQPISTHILAIDTVLCIRRTVALPQQDGRFLLPDGLAEILPALGAKQDADAFRRTRSYAMNLADAEPGGCHCRAKLAVHRIICGGSRQSTARFARDTQLLEDFLDGRGFNLIPLADEQESTRADVRDRPRLFVRRFCHARDLFLASVTMLAPPDGERLLRLVFDEADDLVLGPLEPARRIRRRRVRCGIRRRTGSLSGR